MKKVSLLCLMLTLVVSACKENDPPLPDNVANFEASTLGLGDDTDEIDIKVSLARAVDATVTVLINFTTEGLIYGDHFTTIPAANGNSLQVEIPAGSNQAAFTVVRNAEAFLEGNEKIIFSIGNVTSPALTGDVSEVALSFSAIVSEGAEITLNGLTGDELPGDAPGNSVFVDLSSNVQKAVARTSWDLGFFNGEDFRVIINNTSGASVIMVDKTDINDVSAADVNPADLAVGFGEGHLGLIDDVAGHIGNTAIPAIASADNDNKVYIINRVGGSGTTTAVAEFEKIRVLRNGDHYTLQYARLNETTFNTLEVNKSGNGNFSYVSFDNGAVEFEPAGSKWDIQWGWSIYFTGDLPYAFADLVFINHLSGTTAAEVLTSTVSYDAFGEDDISSVTFSNDRNVIGSNWRVTSPTASAGVKTDRFYVIQDANGNVYKLMFVNFHGNDGGVRGNPKIKYALVQQGA